MVAVYSQNMLVFPVREPAFGALAHMQWKQPNPMIMDVFYTIRTTMCNALRDEMRRQ